MRIARPCLSLLSACVLSAAIHSQTVELRGKVEDGEGACYYCPGYDYVLDGPNFPITSSAANLGVFLSQQVHAVGVWNTSLAAPVVELVSVELASESFSLGGGATVGSELDFTAHGTPGDQVYLLGSLGFGFQPALSSSSVLLLDLSSITLLGLDTIGSDGEATASVLLPAWMSGLEVVGQALVVPANGTPPTFTNADFKTVRP